MDSTDRNRIKEIAQKVSRIKESKVLLTPEQYAYALDNRQEFEACGFKFPDEFPRIKISVRVDASGNVIKES